MKSKRDDEKKRTGVQPPWRKSKLPPEPRNPDELDFDGQPPHHPGAASAPGEGPNPTPPQTGR